MSLSLSPGSYEMVRHKLMMMMMMMMMMMVVVVVMMMMMMMMIVVVFLFSSFYSFVYMISTVQNSNFYNHIIRWCWCVHCCP